MFAGIRYAAGDVTRLAEGDSNGVPSWRESGAASSEPEGSLIMNHSIATADRGTHLKIVVLALVGAIMVVCVGITARLAQSDASVASAQSAQTMKVGVVKAAKPIAVSSSSVTMVR